MISAGSFIYLASVAQSVGVFLTLICVASLVSSVGIIITRSSDDKPTWCAGLKRSLIICTASGMVACFMPTKETLYLAAAANISQRLAQTPAANELASDANDILRGYLKKLKAGLKEDAK